jgi:hypothetical protein
MQIGGPTNPYLIARAYGTSQIASVAKPAAVGSAGVVGRIGQTAPAEAQAPRATGLEQLVAAVVPGRVDFSGEVPTQRADALPFYRRPGDRNEAATNWLAGRTLDVNG